jgi:hypothetical protein
MNTFPTQNKLMHVKQPIVVDNQNIHPLKCNYKICFKKIKMVDHLQNLEMGMKILSPNDQGTISHILELIIEKILQVRHFY